MIWHDSVFRFRRKIEIGTETPVTIIIKCQSVPEFPNVVFRNTLVTDLWASIITTVSCSRGYVNWIDPISEISITTSSISLNLAVQISHDDRTILSHCPTSKRRFNWNFRRLSCSSDRCGSSVRCCEFHSLTKYIILIALRYKTYWFTITPEGWVWTAFHARSLPLSNSNIAAGSTWDNQSESMHLSAQ